MTETIQVEAPTLADYDNQAIEKTKGRCPHCRGVLGPIQNYDHDGGWPVKGFSVFQWLYKTCRKCGYQWALWKLGISRYTEPPHIYSLEGKPDNFDYE